MTSKVAVVTGANGFVGSHLVDVLLERSYAVRCIVRKSSNLQWLSGKNVEFCYCGLTNKIELEAAFQGASHIFHLAGVVKAANYDGFLTGNVATTACVLEAASSIVGLEHLIITSSLAAHGPNAVGAPSVECDAPKPVSEYGESKLAQEKLVATYFDRLPITIVRPPAVYGERDTEVLLLFKTIQKGVFPALRFEQTLSFVHATDLVTGMIQAAETQKTVGQTYFLGSNPAEYRQLDIAKIVAKALNKRFIHLRLPLFVIYIAAAFAEFFAFFTKKTPTINLKKIAELRQASWACSSEKARQDFGYRPVIDLEIGIKQTIEWYKSKGLM